MNVREIHLKRVMSHDETHLKLPASGIIVITGDNGHGKSTFMEALPAAIWNKTLRGTPWYRQGEVSEVGLVVDGETITRVRKKGKGGVTWSGAAEADTATKAQPGLDARFGSFESWRRTHVFSSQDADHFSTATDKQRKALLEDILGISCFDEALVACRTDLKAAKAALGELEHKASIIATKIKERAAALDRVRSADLGPEPVEVGAGQIAKLKALGRELVGKRDAKVGAITELHEQSIDLRAQERAARERYAHFQSGDCPTCKRKLTEQLEMEVSRDLTTAKAALSSKEAEIETLMREGQALRTQYDKQIASCTLEFKALGRAADERARWVAKRDRVDRLLGEERGEIGKLRGDLLDREDEIDEAAHNVALTACAEKALGLRGIRAHVLQRATAGVEDIANLWLARLFPGVTLSLGGSSDRLELAVAGLHHPFGYQGASGGERRRIDIALLFALAEVAAGAHGVEVSGSIFMDEVMDTLDPAGAQAASEVLLEMAKDRVVVVITHSEELTSQLSASMRLRVVDGAVQG